MVSLLSAPRASPEELEHVIKGTVDGIHRDVKQRFLMQMPEALRIRIDVRHLVSSIRGEQYARLQWMRGEDFMFVAVRSSLHLSSIRVEVILEPVLYHLQLKFGIDVCVTDLTFDLPRKAPVSASYTMLDILFICLILHAEHGLPLLFEDTGKILFLKLTYISHHLTGWGTQVSAALPIEASVQV